MKKWMLPAFLLMLTFFGFTHPAGRHGQRVDKVKKISPDAVTDWKIGVQMWTFRMFSFADALKKLDSAGVKYTEAFFGQKLGADMNGSFGFDMSAETRAKLKELLKTRGGKIMPMGVITPRNRE